MSLQENQTALDKLPPYILNWAKTTISLAKGRFKHYLSKPSKELLLERDKEIKNETPIAKDNSYSANANSDEQETVDAKYYEKIKMDEAEGYPGEVPERHKAKAWGGLYQRHIFIPDEADPFADIVPVHEVIGDPDNPTHEIIHYMRRPEDADLKKMDKAIKNGRYVPDKRGRQKYVVQSYLLKATTFYSLYLESQEGSAIEVVTPAQGERGEAFTENIYFSEENRERFINETDILIQRRVVEVLVSELMDNLLD